jgi:hypothetical protein
MHHGRYTRAAANQFCKFSPVGPASFVVWIAGNHALSGRHDLGYRQLQLQGSARDRGL